MYKYEHEGIASQASSQNALIHHGSVMSVGEMNVLPDFGLLQK